MKLQEVILNGGLDFNGVWITDIYLDESGRFEVDPRTYYNIEM
jgi:hypothetical protein